MSVTLRYLYGGEFYLSQDNHICYRKNKVFFKNDVDPDLLSKIELEVMLLEAGLGIDIVKELWYPKPGVTLNEGLRQVCIDNDIIQMCASVGQDKTIHLYVVQANEPSPAQLKTQPISPRHGGRLSPFLFPQTTPKRALALALNAIKTPKSGTSAVTRLLSSLDEDGELSSDDDEEGGELESSDSDEVEVGADFCISESSSDDSSTDHDFEVEQVFGDDQSDDEQIFIENVDKEVNEGIDRQ